MVHFQQITDVFSLWITRLALFCIVLLNLFSIFCLSLLKNRNYVSEKSNPVSYLCIPVVTCLVFGHKIVPRTILLKSIEVRNILQAAVIYMYSATFKKIREESPGCTESSITVTNNLI